jgi:2-octaprenyl-6-methoxyphenol hydroxylase
MAHTTTDILISGGGVAGLSAAAAFGSAGFSVICVDPTAPITSDADNGADLRTTAILNTSIPVLQAAGLWARLEPFAAPLQVMRIVDAGGPTAEARLVKNFDAADISDQPFGWNLPNWLLRREMVARLSELDSVDFRPGTGTASLITRTDQALVTLTDGSRVRARLVIAADGRNSVVRQAMGIGVSTLRYGQKALAFAVTHPHPHNNVSTEVHRTGGPFTLVPLPDRDGQHRSAVVWMDRGPEIARLQALPPDAFNAEMTARSCAVLGELALASRLTVWPIISQIAETMVAERVALMAEAAHVVPPIGAQGLNMSLADLTALFDLATTAPDTLGSAAMLDAYHRKRHLDVRARVTGIDALNRASMMNTQGLRDLRASALDALYSTPVVRKTLMRAGLGLR